MKSLAMFCYNIVYLLKFKDLEFITLKKPAL